MAVAVLHESTLDEAGLTEPASADASATDRRAQVRLSAEDASWLRGARLKYGPAVRVIDISTGGILVESEGAPLASQSNVVFELSTQTGTMLMPARVLRSQPVEGSTRHQTACSFKRPLSIATLAAVTREPSPAPTAARASWQRVVARLRNGQVQRGYTNDFHPSKAHLHLTPEDKSGETMFLAVSQLKAVFFVREFAGDPSRVDRTEFDNAHHGRKIEVTFDDGEVLRGTTLAYRDNGCGFFVQPADAGSNNMRVFVSPDAIVDVRLL
jgi:PilZ domain